VRKADNLLPSSADVTESENLNLSEPSGPHRAVMELLYLLLCVKVIYLIDRTDLLKISNFTFGWKGNFKGSV
jgi:hypothetical protein